MNQNEAIYVSDESIDGSDDTSLKYVETCNNETNDNEYEMFKALLFAASYKIDNNLENCFVIYQNILNFVKVNILSEIPDTEENNCDNWKQISVLFEKCYDEYLSFDELYLQTGRYKEEFEEISDIGSGGFGTVCKAKHKFNDKVYAIKKIPIQERNDCLKLFKELKILANLSCDYVVQYNSAWIESIDKNDFNKNENLKSTKLRTIERSITKSRESYCRLFHAKAILYIQMELCSSTLREIIDVLNAELNQTKYTYPTSIGYYIASELFIEILECVDYLHKLDKPVIHRDLKPANILITDGTNGRFVKIADFGLSTLHTIDIQTHTQCCGTQEYTAPEVWNGRKYNTKADIYSLGVIMKELLNLDMNATEDLSMIKIGTNLEFKVQRTKYVSAAVIYSNMLSTTASLRPSSELLLINKSLWSLSLEELLTDRSLDSSFQQQMIESTIHYFNVNFMKQKFLAKQSNSCRTETINSNHLVENDSFGIFDVSNYMINIFENIKQEESKRLDPIIMDQSIQKQFIDEKGGFNVTLDIETDSKIIGISKIEINKFKAEINLNEFKFEVIADVSLAELRHTGNYRLKGKVFRFFPISGNGLIFIELKNVCGKVIISGNFNDQLMKTDSVEMNMSFSSVFLHFENLVDSKMSPFLNSLINSIAKPLVDLLVLKNKHQMELINQKLKQAIDYEIKTINVRNILTHLQKL